MHLMICFFLNLIQNYFISIKFIITFQINFSIYILSIDGFFYTVLSLKNYLFLLFVNIINRISKEMLKFTKRTLTFSYFKLATYFVIIEKLVFVNLTYFDLVDMGNNLGSDFKHMGINFI